MKKKIAFLLVFCFLLTACSNKQIAINEYENSSYYDHGHEVAESKDGYYKLYKDLLTFIDKKTLKVYLVSREKDTFDQLLADESKKIESDAYFEGGEEVFYEDKKVYISSKNSLSILDEQTNTIEKIQDIGYSTNNRVLYKGVFYYILHNLDPGKEDLIVLEKFDTRSKKYEPVIKLKDKIKKMGFEQLGPKKYYILKDRLYIYTSLLSGSDSRYALISLDLDGGNLVIDLCEDYKKNYRLSNLYLDEEKMIKLFDYFNNDDEHAWEKNGTKILITDLNGKKIKEEGLDSLKNVVFSKTKRVETPFEALSVYKSFDFDDKLKAMDYVLSFEGKNIKLSENYFLKNNPFVVKLSDGGDILLSYDDGKLVIIRDGEIHEIYK